MNFNWIGASGDPAALQPEDDTRRFAPVDTRETDPLRLYAIFSKEVLDQMKGSRGKLAAQAGHAYLHAFWNAEVRFPEEAISYRNAGRAYKIGLVVPTTKDLQDIYPLMYPLCGATLVEDAGYTVFTEPTITCVGLGPIRRSLLEQHLPGLKTLQ